ncbi:unnamed protein product [Adineta steineri]|uniref:RING-type domain-containing protein n=1 Tax=Adineta steineri TaxID=433720 RepID=A0A818V3Z8_9BILA|nr:unnamed protein product [Adineta steineri]CAF3707067.1 unnamed protein product [Adineta steineri]
MSLDSSKINKKDEPILCFGCRDKLEENHAGIQCAQGHHLCMPCSANLVAMCIAEPNINLPPRCMVCKIELNSSVFERQLKPEQFVQYTNIMLSLSWSKDILKDNEELIYCAFCSYVEIRVKSPGAQFMFCKHQGCGKTSCLICLHKVTMLEENYDDIDDEEYEEYENNIEEIEKHFKCAELGEAKKIVEMAIENGQKVPCPECGLAGMKDDACTHMTCPECQTYWCYFCGLKEIDCDKSISASTTESVIPIYRHNESWEINPKRCPMYLTAVCDIDDNWPSDENECLEYFHRIRSLKFLRRVYEQLGAEVIEQLNERFGTIDASGFALDDIRYEDLTLINYDNHDDMSDEENECNVDMRTADNTLDEENEYNGDIPTADNEIYIVLD